MGVIRNLIGTLLDYFRIGRATVSAASVSTPRTYSLPDKASSSTILSATSADTGAAYVISGAQNYGPLPYQYLQQAWAPPSLGAPNGAFLLYAGLARGASPPDTFAFWATETNEALTDALVTLTGTGYLGFDLVNSDRARANLGLGDLAEMDVSDDPDNMAGVDGDGDLLVLLGRVGLLLFKDPSTGAPVTGASIQGYLAKGSISFLELAVGASILRLAESGITAIGNVSVSGNASVFGTVSATHFNISSAIYGGAVSPTMSGNINNWQPTNWSNRSMFRVTPSAAWIMTGAAAVDSSRRTILNVSSINPLTLAHESSSSTAANRFICPDNIDYVIKPNAAVDIWYDPTSTRWRVIR